MQIHQWRGPGYRISASEDRFFSSPLQESTVFRFSTDFFEVEPHAGAFSIKLVLSGEEHYRFGRRTVALRPGQVLLVNAGDEYSSRIDTLTESLSIFFRDSEFEAAARSLTAPAEMLLDTQSDRTNVAGVARIIRAFTPAFEARLGASISAIDRNDEPALTESVRCLLLTALLDHWGVVPPEALSEIRRRSTRDELVTRILRARELIDHSHGRTVDLDRLAAAACLSRYHFLRVFTELMGETPIAYARRRRLQYGRKLLKQGEDPAAVAKRLGYKSVRNFRRAYQRTFGQPVDPGPAPFS